jgi:branched-subunit amino acid transport protein
MRDVWLTIAGLAITTAAIKASGPIVLGGRRIPARATRVLSLLGPAVLSALVVTQTFADNDGALTLDERALGVTAAAAAFLLRSSILATIVVAAAVTAMARALIG